MYRRFWINYLWILILTGIFGCSVKPLYPLRSGASDFTLPDYSDADLWAALPSKEDAADEVPDSTFSDLQAISKIDVFFLHPTSYTGDRGQRYWNANLDDQEVNAKTDRTSILHQASIFNGVGRIFAPRYRQAHIHAYFTRKNRDQAREAFEIAYRDVVASFEYYLEHYNEGRPIIIASHSQGTTHGMRLLKDYFDGKALQEKLVVAYLVGIPVYKNFFKNIPLCKSPDQTGCFCSWRTYREGFLPKRFPASDSIAVVNPLSWTTTGRKLGKENNKGAVLRKYHNGIWPQLTDAQINKGVLWARRPKFPGSFLLRTKNYHAGDYNLYWVNVRENVEERTINYLNKSSTSK